MKKFGSIIVVIMMIGILVVGVGVSIFGLGNANFKRNLKSLKSNFNNGLERTVSVYSYDGELINAWSGKFDVTESEHETCFDIDDKRVIIQGGIIINEEH